MGPPLDLQFQQFTHYEVQGKGQHTGHGQFWICQCVCGQQRQIHEAALVEGRATGCGCTYVDNRGVRHPRFCQLIGQQFGKLLVFTRATIVAGKGHAQWVCQCECGTQIIRGGTDLKSGDSAQCRMCRYQGLSKVQVSRWYGDLFIESRSGINAHGDATYLCRCRLCGRKKKVPTSSLLRGVQCSCAQKGRRVPIIGEVFGRWKVLAHVGMSHDHQSLYRCQCLCALQTIKTVRGKLLVSGDSQSCGCLRRERSGEGSRAFRLKKSQDVRLDWTLDILRQHAAVQPEGAATG